MTTATDVQKVADLIKKNDMQIVDLKFTDLPGLWQHFSIPPKDMVDFEDLQGSIWVDGIGFDGSSIRTLRPPASIQPAPFPRSRSSATSSTL